MTFKAGRVEEFKFGEITANSSGHIDVYSDRPINGRLWAVQVLGNNFGANGSTSLAVSGGNFEQLWYREGTASTSGTVYPRATARFTDNGLASGTNFTQMEQIALNSVLRLTISGVGASKSGLGVNVVYI